MKEILVINPVKRNPKKKEKAMAKGRKRSKSRRRRHNEPNPRKTVRRRRRTNPSKSMRVRRAARSIGKTILGMNIKAALGNVPPAVLGMVAAKWASKRFSEGGASETDPESWTWSSYLKGAIGALAGGFIAQSLRAGWGQKVLEGGLNLMVYKLVQNELVPRSEWAQAQFGEQDSAAIQYDSEGRPYFLGSNGQWYPADERHRLPEAAMLGDELLPPGRLGDELVVPGRLGDIWQDAYFGQEGNQSTDVYAKAFFG
jgi:hypothetical protein